MIDELRGGLRETRPVGVVGSAAGIVEARRVREQLIDGDLVAVWKIRNVFRERIVERQLAAIGEDEDRCSGDRFRDRGDLKLCVRRVRRGEPAIGNAERALVNDVAVPRDEYDAAEELLVRVALYVGVDLLRERRKRSEQRECKRQHARSTLSESKR